MQVEIWSDVVCPWCAIGRARFARALDMFAQRDAVTVRWRSFELDPAAPRSVAGSYVDRLAGKYRVSRARAQAMIDRMTAQAAAEGLTFRFDQVRPGNTFDAHRLLHLAADRQVQRDMVACLMTAYLSQGAAIGDPATLVELATGVGLDASEVAAVLDGDAYADAVHADEEQAAAFGIGGVPFFVLDRRFGVSGAQPVTVLHAALVQAHRAGVTRR
ncbi:MAG TPA: DsbA family oxidoreductase [Euzebyales bacterium]|nr:DsbA family oxidoreductase [Euzebyales bacterium]